MKYLQSIRIHLLTTKGIIIGLSIAAPVGPIGILCIRRSLNQGRLYGFISGVGAATADALYGCVAATGLTIISHFLIDQRFWNSSYSKDIFLGCTSGNAVEKLPTEVNANNTQIFFEFFTKYGVYYTQKIVLGGSLKFLSSIEKKEQLSSQKLDVMFNAQYDGLFSSGSIDVKITGSQDWKTFSQNSKQSIVTKGGTPEAVAAFQQINPLNPNSTTVDAYKQWVASLQTDPAIVDFQLTGIWQLCGDKERAVLDAWQAFGEVMHPRLTVYTSSSEINWPYVTNPVTPTMVSSFCLKSPLLQLAVTKRLYWTVPNLTIPRRSYLTNIFPWQMCTIG